MCLSVLRVFRVNRGGFYGVSIRIVVCIFY